MRSRNNDVAAPIRSCMMVLVCLCSAKQLIAEVPRSAVESTLEQVLSAPWSDAAEAIERLSNARLGLSTDAPGRPGFFEYVLAFRAHNAERLKLSASEGTPMLRQFAVDGSTNVEFWVMKQPLRFVYRNLRLHDEKTTGLRVEDGFRWGLVIGERGAEDCLAGGFPEGRPSPQVRVEPGAWLATLRKADDTTLSWHPPTQTLTLTSPDNQAHAIYRFRTPNDQRRCGSILSEVRTNSSDDMPCSLRNFAFTPEFPLRLRLPEPHALVADPNLRPESPAIQLSSGPTPADFFGSSLGKSFLAWNRLPCPAAPPLRIDGQEKSLFAAMLASSTGIAVGFKADQSPNPALVRRMQEQFLHNACEQMELAAHAIDLALQGDENIALVDDPQLRWLGLERAESGVVTEMLYVAIVDKLLTTTELPLAAKVRLCAAFGGLGCSPRSLMPLPDFGEGASFLRAILHSRWNWPPSEEEVQACHDMLEDRWATSIERHAAMETLIRWGILEGVGGDHELEWRRDIVNGNAPKRLAAWKTLSRYQQGREYLEQRHAELKSSSRLQQEIAQVLHARASATLACGRFDFIPEAECHRLLECFSPGDKNEEGPPSSVRAIDPAFEAP